MAENATGTVGQYTVGGAGCGSVSWLALGGADASAFALQGAETAASRSLHFVSAPDYETKNSYQVEVRVRVGSAEKSLAVSVSVSNEDEPGAVVLRGGVPPQVGTAVVAQFSDPDGGVSGASWQWQRRLGASGVWEAVGSGVSGTADVSGAASEPYPELSSYTPVLADVGWQVRATIGYRDGQDPNTDKRAEGEASAAVIGPPGVPQAFEAVASDGQVALRWQAPASDGGSQ